MALTPGRHVLYSIVFGEKKYNIVAIVDIDTPKVCWLQVIIGDPGAGNPEVISANKVTKGYGRSPLEAVQEAVRRMNEELADYFGSNPAPPQDWFDEALAHVARIKLTTVDGNRVQLELSD